MAAALSLSSFTVSPERSINASPSFLFRNIAGSAAPIRIFPVTAKYASICSYSGNISLNNCYGMKVWMFGNVNFQWHNKISEQKKDFKNFQYQGSVWAMSLSGTTPLHDGEHVAVSSAAILSNVSSLTDGTRIGRSPAISIAVIGATGELARRKIFPALFALYYSGQLPQNFSIFGYSRKELTDEDLRAIIATTLTCRIDEQQNCEDKMEAFLKRIHYLNGGFNNREGMLKLHVLMEHVEGKFETNRIFYLSVPQEALSDVALSIAEHAQTEKGWNRIIIEKPFGCNSLSSHRLTSSLLSNFEEKQLYRIDHLLGRNTIENLTVLRFSNLVFMPLWNRNYIQSVQVIFSEEVGMQSPIGICSNILSQPNEAHRVNNASTEARSHDLPHGRDHYLPSSTSHLDASGIIGDVVHSHILQTIALLAMEPPVTLDGEDVRNEKVKVLRSIRKIEPSDVILGRYDANPKGQVDGNLSNLAPTYFSAALYIDNARWDGVPFLIKAGRGLNKNRVEIRIQFRHVAGNLYHKDNLRSVELATNELVLRDVPEESILVRINNKVPGLGMHLDASELNLLYKDRYDIEVPDSYEQLLHDVIDGDNHLFMRSDEVAAAWNILSTVLHEMGNSNVVVEQYKLGSKGPDGAADIWAKHGVQWLDE